MKILDNNIFTQREGQILEYALSGLTNSQIASTLKISSHTVKAHIDRIYEKINVHSKVQMAVYAIKHGIIKLD